MALALYYAPTPDHAWDSVRYVTTDVRGGDASCAGCTTGARAAMVVAVAAASGRVVFFGSYRKPREMNWLIGLALLHVILAFALTGYLLPWDQRAYWATVVTINISKLTPVAGDGSRRCCGAGREIGALTLTRWYALHVVVLPAALVGLVVAHLYLMRRHGISGPVTPRPGASQPFFPYQAARDLTVAVVAGVVLAVLAWNGAPALEPPADPTSSDYVPRPEWYFLGLFQLLKYFPGRLEVIGAIVIPAVVMVALAALPWLDRGRTRQMQHRWSVLLPFTAGLVLIGTLTTLGALDAPPASSAWNIREIGGAVLAQTSDRCTRCHKPEGLAAPIQAGRIRQPAAWLAMHVADPEVIAPGVREAPQTNQGESRSMLAGLARLEDRSAPGDRSHDAQDLRAAQQVLPQLPRHRWDWRKEGPDLSRAGQKLDRATIEQRIIDPGVVDPMSEMPMFDGRISRDDIRMIAEWLAQRK